MPEFENPVIERGAIALAGLCNIPEATGLSRDVSDQEFWDKFVPSNRKDTYRMEVKCVLDGIDYDDVAEKAWRYDNLG